MSNNTFKRIVVSCVIDTNEMNYKTMTPNLPPWKRCSPGFHIPTVYRDDGIQFIRYHEKMSFPRSCYNYYCEMYNINNIL